LSKETPVVDAQDEIGPALASLLDRGIDSLVIVGGDGTFPHTLTHLLRRGDPAKLPAIVPTRGGTVNTVAVGRRGAPETLRSRAGAHDSAAPW
jgi:diacylglycerol kinase family enzyme